MVCEADEGLEGPGPPKKNWDPRLGEPGLLADGSPVLP
jgi:hypothetical protein